MAQDVSPNANAEGPATHAEPAAAREATAAPQGKEETAPQGGQENHDPVPRDAVPAETLVTPDDTRVLDQAGVEEARPPEEALEAAEVFDVPIELNDKVRAYLALFTGERRDRIQEAFDRAGRYLPMMRAIF
ncbi:MAG: hypothetical protein ACREKF_00440, partial [Candidatus Methylomirabilales bacterium]